MARRRRPGFAAGAEGLGGNARASRLTVGPFGLVAVWKGESPSARRLAGCAPKSKPDLGFFVFGEARCHSRTNSDG